MSDRIQRNLSFYIDTLSHASPYMHDASSDFADYVPQCRSSPYTGMRNSPHHNVRTVYQIQDEVFSVN